MMHGELVWIENLDEIDSWDNAIASGDDFRVEIRIHVASSEIGGEEGFYLTVCSPKSLERELANASVVSGKHMLIMERFHPDVLSRDLDEAVRACSGETVGELIEALSLIGRPDFLD